MKIGIDSYCFHRFFGEVYDFQEEPKELATVDDFLDFAKSYEVDGVSLETCFLPSLDAGYLRELGAKTKEYGFDTVFAWGHPNGLERGLSPEAFEDMKAMIPMTRELGTDVMRVCASAYDWRKEDHAEQIARLVPMFKEAVKIAEEYDVKMAVENHIDYTADEMIEMIEAVDSPNFGINFDTGNFLRLLDDPVKGMEKLAPYTFSTHIKDLRLNTEVSPADWTFFSGVPVGFGIIDNDKLAELLHKADYKGFLAVEIDAPAPEWHGMEKEMIGISVRNLRKIANKFK